MNKNNIDIDLTNGGFFNDEFISNIIPVSKSFKLEIIDIQGFSTIVACNLIVDINKNPPKIEDLTKNIKDNYSKLMIEEIIKTNYKNNFIDRSSSDNTINILSNSINNIDQDYLILNYNNLISILIDITQNFSEEKISELYDILKKIVNNIDSLLNDLSKIEKLNKVFDNLNTKLGSILGKLYNFINFLIY